MGVTKIVDQKDAYLYEFPIVNVVTLSTEVTNVLELHFPEPGPLLALATVYTVLSLLKCNNNEPSVERAATNLRHMTESAIRVMKAVELATQRVKKVDEGKEKS